MNYDKVVPSGKAVSKSQYHFYEQVLNSIPRGSPRRQLFLAALDVDYNSLPERAGSQAPPPPQSQAPLPRIETIKSGNRVVCYLIRKPQPVFFIASAAVWEKLHESMPELRRSQCMTLPEARSFMELEGEKVKSLKEAAEWWASPAPAEPTVKQPPAADKPWVDDENPFACYGDEDDDDSDVFNR
jgi:hypothetical protein